MTRKGLARDASIDVVQPDTLHADVTTRTRPFRTRTPRSRMAFATTTVKATRAPTLASTRVQRRQPKMRCVRASANKVRESVDVGEGVG